MTTQAISYRRPGLRLAPATLAVAAAVAGWSAPSQAVRFGSEEGLSGSFDSVVSFGMTRRMSGTDCRTIGNDSGGCNNGTNNELQARPGANGYANAEGDWRRHSPAGAIALPVRLGERVVGCLNVVYLRRAMAAAEAARELLPALREAVAAIEAGLATAPARAARSAGR